MIWVAGWSCTYTVYPPLDRTHLGSGSTKHRKGPQKRRKRTAKELRNTATYAVGPVLAHLRLKCCIYVIQQFFVALLIFASQVGGLRGPLRSFAVFSITLLVVL